MHQTQFVKARAETLEDALKAFTQHVDANGGIDNWWHWLCAFEPDGARITTPPPESFPSFPFASDDKDRAELIAQIEAQAKYAHKHFSKEDAWNRQPWYGIFSTLHLAGVPWMKFDDSMTDDEMVTKRAIRRKSPANIPEWFLSILLEELRSAYASVSVPPKKKKETNIIDALEDAKRKNWAAAFERVYEALYSPMTDSKPDLPYLRGLSPYEWPAHLVGQGPKVFYLMVDMHL